MSALRPARAGAALLGAAAIAVLAGVGAILACVHPRYTIGLLVGDDGGYYLAIVRNLVLGHGFSFDRLHPTNGFNPLEPLLLWPLFRALAPACDLVACYRAATLLSFALVVAGAVALHRLAGRVLAREGFPEPARPLARAAVAFFYAGFLAVKGYYAMDAFPVLAIGLVYLARVAAHGPLAPGTRAALADGALLALACLARVDSLPLVAAAFGVMGLAAFAGAGGARALAARAGVFAAGVAPYVAWGERWFGTWLPVSARIKSGFPHLDPARSLDAVLHSSLNPADLAGLAAALIAALAWLAALAPALRSRAAARALAADPPRAAMALFAAYAAARLGFLLAFSRFDVQGSYFILAHPFTALAALVVAGRLARRAPAWAPAGALALAALTAALLAGKARLAAGAAREIARGHGDEYAIARRIHAATGDGDVLYGGAFGLIGYFADRPWLNGDGVANDMAYQEAIRARRLTAYLDANRVTQVVLIVPAGRPPAPRLDLEVASAVYGTTDHVPLDARDPTLRVWTRRGGGAEIWLVRWPAGAGS